jgi:hypothetical protein
VRQRSVELWPHHSSVYWQNIPGVANGQANVAGDVRIIVIIISGINFPNIGFSGNSAANLLTIMALIAVVFLLCMHKFFCRLVKSWHVYTGCKGT